jgi:hypothetical protein
MRDRWQRVTAIQWVLPDDEGFALRTILARGHRIGEPNGTK